MQISRRKFIAFASLSAAAFTVPRSLRAARLNDGAADSLLDVDAVGQAEMIRAGDITPLELLEATIERIEALNPRVNAVVTKLYDRAREAAKQGDFEGPFAGVPFLVKDLDDLAGARTTSGCRAKLNHIADKTEPYIQACIDIGFNPCGKTNTPEFGLQGTTESLALGPCYNPWDLTRSSGGSSGGAGAAVATGMVPLAQGSDGGGSIRIPACCCGIFGLKVSRGRQQGTGNEFGLSVKGPLTRTVRDTAYMLAATERKKPGPGLEPVGLVEGPARRRLKIGMFLQGSTGQEPAPDVASAIHSTASLCRELGHEVVDAQFEFDGQQLADEFLALWASVPGGVANALEKELGRPVTHQDLEPLTLAFAERFRNGGQQKMLPAVASLVRFSRDISRQIEGYDVLLSPVLSSTPPVIGEQAPTVPFELLIERMSSYVAYTPFYNITGMPAMSVPLAWSDAGLPIGSQFGAPLGGERTLLELAYELEAARPWAKKWAPVSIAQANR